MKSTVTTNEAPKPHTVMIYDGKTGKTTIVQNNKQPNILVELADGAIIMPFEEFLAAYPELARPENDPSRSTLNDTGSPHDSDIPTIVPRSAREA